MKDLITLAVTLTVAVLALALSATADVPHMINYQGRLTDSTGNPVSGSYNILFTIYDQPENGNELWQEQHSDLNGNPVEVQNGLFGVILGDSTAIPDSIFNGSVRWLAIKVGSEEMTPRTRLISIGYAYHALRSDTAAYANHALQADSAQYAGEAATVAPGSIGATEANSSEVQLRVDGTCPTGYYISQINEDGSVVCTEDSSGVTDHGDLEGLLDNDHPQYLLTSGGTINGDVLFGDSIMAVCSDMVVIGKHSCYSDRSTLLKIDRWIETDVGMFHGIDLDIDNEVGTSTARGIYSKMTSWNGAATGIYGKGVADVGTGIGVEGRGQGGVSAYGIVGHGLGASNNNYAGKFYDDVDIIGILTKGGGAFRIDHPLDPENKYLQHSFVESPDMMNIYNGNAVLDAEGRAIVELPDYFEAVNRDFRYQLTCIGGYAPVYISEEISGNRFTIAGGVPSMKVSWQVTGVRHDKWAEANRIQVEVVKKPNERGLYRHPELYGFGTEKHVDHDLLKDMREESAR